MKRFLLLTASLVVSLSSVAQEISTSYFTDDTKKPVSRVRAVAVEGDYAYIGGWTQNACGTTPHVQKVNVVTGEEIWSTANVASYVAFEEQFVITTIAVIGDYVYAMAALPHSSTFGRLWRIDKVTGQIGWRTQWLDGSEGKIWLYFENQLLVHSFNKLRIIDIGSGAIVATHELSNNTSISANGNREIYMAFLPLQRVTNFDFANPTTVADMPMGPTCESGSIAEVHALDDNKLLVFGLPCGTRVVLIDLITKQVIWQADAGEEGYDVQSFVVKGNDLYVSWRPNNNFNMLYGMRASRINFTTGQVLWNSVKFFSRAYDHDSSIDAYYRPQGNAISIDADNTGDVYLTGTAGATGFDGDWGIMKLSGANGDLIYEKIMAVSDKRWDQASGGRRVVVRDDTPYFIGNMLIPDPIYDFVDEYGPNNLSLIKLNGATGAVQRKTDLQAKIIEPSVVRKVVGYEDNTTLLLENKGPVVLLTRFDEKNIV